MRRYSHHPAHCGVIHGSQEADATQAFVHRRLEKLSVICAQNEILFRLTKQGSPVTGSNTDQPEDMTPSERSQSLRGTSRPIPFNAAPRVVRSTEKESRMVVARGRGKGNGEFVSNGDSFGFTR